MTNEMSEAVLSAVMDGNIEELKRLLRTGGDINQPWEGQLPLVEAARLPGGVELVVLLVDAGADVNQKDELEDDSALTAAVGAFEVETVKALISRGADPNIVKEGIVVPLSIAARRRKPQATEIARLLISAGADVNFVAKTSKGIPSASVLMDAAERDNREVLLELVKAGAAINGAYSLGTALTVAAQEGNDEIVKLLLHAGADPNIPVPDWAGTTGYRGKTALDIARLRKRRKVIELLETAKVLPRARVGVEGAWQVLEESLRRNKMATKSLRPGANSLQIQTLENVIKRKLSDSAKAFFAVHDGQEKGEDVEFILSNHPLDMPFRLLSLEEIAVEWQSWSRLSASGEFKRSKPLPDKGVLDVWCDPGWIPLTSNGAGDHHCLDLVPAEGGNVGQIIMLFHDQAARPRIAGSLSEWLLDVAESQNE